MQRDYGADFFCWLMLITKVRNIERFCVEFSLVVINSYLGRSEDDYYELEVTNNLVCKVITTNQTVKHAGTCAPAVCSNGSFLKDFYIQ